MFFFLGLNGGMNLDDIPRTTQHVTWLCLKKGSQPNCHNFHTCQSREIAHSNQAQVLTLYVETIFLYVVSGTSNFMLVRNAVKRGMSTGSAEELLRCHT